jgi:hypothetical protein
MKYIPLFALLLLILTSSSNCKKGSLFGDKLPSATQEGKNTCGFLLNGDVWLPKGDNGYPNLNFYYDETYMGGTLGISGYRYEANRRTTFALGGNNITRTGIYKLNSSSEQLAQFSIDDNSGFCIYEWYDTVSNYNAYLNLTKLDKVNRIVSGTFEFALVKPGCEEVIVTQGRFDMKY